MQIHIPPLRVRGTDALLIAQALLDASTSNRHVEGITQAAADKLLCYGWPGNVRELSNCIERAVALARGDELTVDDLPDAIRAATYHPPQTESSNGAAPMTLMPLEDVERGHIEYVLDAVSGNKTLAAKILKLDRKTLYRKLRCYEVVEDTNTNP